MATRHILYKMGYLWALSTGGATVFSSGHASLTTSTPILLDKVHCSGNESILTECDRFSDIGIHTCRHSQDVGIICYGKNTVHILLFCGKLPDIFVFTQLLISVKKTMEDVTIFAMIQKLATLVHAIQDILCNKMDILALVSHCFSLILLSVMCTYTCMSLKIFSKDVRRRMLGYYC